MSGIWHRPQRGTAEREEGREQYTPTPIAMQQAQFRVPDGQALASEDPGPRATRRLEILPIPARDGPAPRRAPARIPRFATLYLDMTRPCPRLDGRPRAVRRRVVLQVA